MARTARLALLASVSIAAIFFVFSIAPATANGSGLRLVQPGAGAGVLPLAAGAIASAEGQSSSAVLTNADVIKMVQAHLSAEVVVGQIESSACRFSLTTNGLIALKQAGVPDKVIEAMQAKGGGAAGAGSGGSAHGSGGAIGGREYSIAEFERLLPGVLSKAATAHGLDAHSYDKEAAYIDQFLDKCALDGSNLKVQMPNSRDAAYEICQRRTYQHLHIGNFLDVSLAANNPHSSKGGPALGRGDLMMDVGQPPNQQWWPGESYTLALKVFLDWGPPQGGSLGQFRFEDVLEGARIKGLPPKPGEASAATSAPAAPGASGSTSGTPAATSGAGSKMPGGAYPVFDPASNDAIGAPVYLLPLLYLRNTPGVFDDPQMLRSFVQLVSCKGVTVSQLKNEFGDTPLATFYRENAAKILSNVPSTFTEQFTVTLGEYDFSAGAFPIKVTNGESQSLDHVDVYGRFAPLKQCSTTGDNGRFELAMNGGRFYYEVAFSPLVLDRIAMDQASARSYIEQHPNRQVTIVLSIGISGDAPKVVEGSGSVGRLEPTVVFAGRVSNVSIYDNYPNGKTLAVFDPSKASAPGPAVGSSPSAPGAKDSKVGPGSTPNPTGNSASPSAAASTTDAALPVPVVHDGVAGKVLMGFVEKCSTGDSKGCEMVGFDLERGWGADKDPVGAKAYYQKACSMGRKNDCGR